ncbi:WxL protein peptidoglycan domain-containing protein [Promicromonospora sp. NPDC057488]|uniref:WxL protein peptidoglycan domain-containing protein n=1 Tax=Promicromonospora sp. NPDC057488 TaxID=3346147 RepID=UPI00366CA464
MSALLHRAGPLPRRASGRAAAAVALLTALLLAAPAAAPTAMADAVAVQAGTAGTASTAADDGISWSVTPADNRQGDGRANYAYAVEPGDRVEDALVVTNRSAAPLALTVYGTDAFTTPSGHLDLLTADEPPTGLGTWLTFERGNFEHGTLDLDPGESAEVPFTLRVPDDAAPGDHSGGVVTALTQTVGDTALTVDRRLALRVHARVAGALAPGLDISDLTVSTDGTANPFGTVTSTVRYRLTNTGTARLVPTETVAVAGPGGTTWPGGAASASGELTEILPGSTVERVVEVSGVRPLVRAEASVRVDGLVVGVGGGGVTSVHDAASGWAVPWTLLAFVLLAVAAAVVVPLVRARRSRGIIRE